MLAQLKIYGAVFAGVAAVGGAVMYSQANDLKNKYTLVDARITDVAVDCYIERRKKKVVHKDSSDLAYMDCRIAPVVAAQHGFEETDIKKRASVTYRYRSPVDDAWYTGTYTRTGDIDAYVRGRDIRVHAHNSEPDKSRTTRGNLFIDDTGT